MGDRDYQLKRSAGTVMPWDLARNRLRGPDDKARRADIEAIDRDEDRTIFCSFRGTYGAYPRRFQGYLVDLTPHGLILRPMLLLRFLWRRIPIREEITAARVRPFESTREAFQLQATGQYAPGGKLEWAGTAVVSCQTPQGTLEFAVKRPDIDLILHYLDRRHDPPRRESAE